MTVYSYRAKNKDKDELTEGLVEAETENLAVEILEDKGFQVLALEEKKRNLLKLSLSFERVKIKDLVIFSRQMSVLISASVPLVSALKDAVKQTKNKKLKKIIMEIRQKVEGGLKFSEALAQYPKEFDNFFVNIIKSGESSGRLEEVLVYLADELEKDYDLRSKIKGAMIYPVFVVGGLVVMGFLMMIFVVPKLTEMLSQTGAELPLSTRMLIGLSNGLRGFWWLVVLIVIGLVLLVRAVAKTSAGRRAIDEFRLRAPVFGRLFKYIAVVRFTRSFRTLLIGGVEIIESLKISSAMVSNSILRDLLLKTVKTVGQGGRLAENFEKSPHMPEMVGQMLDTGEETGKIEEVLEKLTQFYSREIKNLLNNLMALMEPFIMIILGVAVGIMIAAIVLPMYQISTNM